jgi:hypothetical protein
VRRSAGTLLLIFALTHLALLPRTLEDLDSINFALGVQQFDVARHQPHPPGYPVFIGLAKISTAAMRALHVDAAAPRGLAFWSAVCGAAAIPALLLFFAALERRSSLAWWATIVTICSPLFWSTALRPLSDMTGFALAIGAQALIVRVLLGRPGEPSRPAPDTSLVLAAFLAGFAIGVRSQTAALTLPLLLLALVWPRPGLGARASVSVVIAGVLGVLAWAIPLIVASGGPTQYLHALGAQAGEDFSGVVMLWTHRTPRVAVSALVNTFVWPWSWWIGIVVCVLAAIGIVRMALRSMRAVIVLAVSFAPYAAFHLLFHETETIRYALPLVPAVAYAAVAALEGPARMMPVGAAVIAAASLYVAVPASVIYSHEGAPVFRAFDDMAATAHVGDRVDTIGIHASARRAAEWAAPILPGRVAKAPHGREWLTLVALWKAQPSARVWLAADPRRTDLALFDPRARDLARSYRWGFVEPPIVGGARPDNIDWYHMEPPGWMLDRGWSITAEVGGVTARDGLGPHVAPTIAWVRARTVEAALVIGGRNLGSASDGPVTLNVSAAGTPVASWPIPSGFFLHQTTIPSGCLDEPSAFVPLAVTAESRTHVPVSLEQFDVQGPGVPMFGYGEGWHEPEYNQSFGRAWRWASERSVLWVRPVGRPVVMHIRGESPLRYFESAPHVRITVAGREVAAFDPAADFDQAVTIPADALEQAQGQVVLESSRFFVPGRNGAGDQRHLGLRIYGVSVE